MRLDVALLERSLGLRATTRATRSGDSVKVSSLGADTLNLFWAVSTLGSFPLYDEVTLAMMAGSQSVLLRSMAHATIGRGSTAWTKEGRKHINSFRNPLSKCLPRKYWEGQLDLALSQLDALIEQLESAGKPFEEIAKKDPRIIRLMTIPGVGKLG